MTEPRSARYGTRGFASRVSAACAGFFLNINPTVTLTLPFTNELFDGLSEFNSVVGYIFNPRNAGYYQVNAEIQVDVLSNATAPIMFDVIRNVVNLIYRVEQYVIAARHYSISLSHVFYLTPNDSIRFDVTNNDPINILSLGPLYCYMSIHRLS